jgi:hypothetical protein
VNVHGLFCRLGLAAILCGTATCQRAEEPRSKRCKFHGRVDRDVTLTKACSPYLIRGGIDVLNDSTLTIEPGVEMRFTKNDWLEIAAAGTSGARLIARGTPEDPIILTSLDSGKRPSKTWLGLWFNKGTREGSIIANAIIRVGGGNNRHIKPTLVHGCITVTEAADAAVTIENVVLESCVNAGVVLERTRPTMTGLTLKDMKVGFLLDGVARDAVPAATTYSGVAQQVVDGSARR